MKNFFKKLRKEKNEKGSGIILVIVALSFLGIIAGALLTAVAYAYRLKLYDYNAKDNFHYVEQAMDEVYAGLGGRTTTTMQDAYTRTVEEMVEFDLSLRAYKNIGDAKANEKFKNYFMNGIKKDTAFTNIATLTQLIESYISNSSVKVDNDNMRVVYYKSDGTVALTITKAGAGGGDIGAALGDDVQIDKIVIQNLVLRRTANYQRSSASGTFTQTISTDIEISRPDFNVQFNTVSSDNSVLYDYALVSDSGIEINKSAASPLLINGNIYASADFYNKNYNQYGADIADYDKDQQIEGTDIKVALNKVSSKTHGSDKTYLFNARLADLTLPGTNKDGVLDDGEFTANENIIKSRADLLYNGYNENSKYSGLYVNGAKVSIMADTVVVPGSIAVMNGANLSVYNSSGTDVTRTNVWADNVILGGYNYTLPSSGSTTTMAGSKATFFANMFVRDDLEVNSDNSDFKLIGAYYGYGNGTQTKRSFVPTISSVATGESTSVNIYQQGSDPATAVDRTHYNSSAIVVNGEKSTLDLSETTTLYIAGQAYLELSAKHEEVDYKVDNSGNGGDIVYASGSTERKDVKKEVLTYDPTVNDYRTGESLSVKSNQLIYIPNGTGTYDDVKDSAGNVIYQTIAINSMLLTPDSTGSNLFEKYFDAFYTGTGSDRKMMVPCVSVVPAGSTRTYHYFDFDHIYEEDDKGYESPEAMAAAFATDYMAELNKSTSAASDNYSPIKEYLDPDITSEQLFVNGEITLPADSSDVYASGALTSIVSQTSGKSYNIIVSTDKGITRPTTVAGDTASGSTSSSSNSLLLSADFAKHYNYLKFSLNDLAAGPEADFIDELVADSSYGEASLSPINRYVDMKQFYNCSPTTDAAASTLDNKLNLASGYKIWVSNADIELKASDCDSEGVIRGIVISQGDVYFGAGIKKFEGLIVAGDKIYIGEDVSAISASPEICKAIMTELQTEKDPDAEKVLRIFRGFKSTYDSLSLDELKALCNERGISYSDNPSEADLRTLLIQYDNNGDNTVKKINTIDYSDVIRYNNWMKNVD